jgi:carboxylate-amine ligase
LPLDLDHARETFDASQDFTIGLEEEFAIVNPQTLELEHRFEDVMAACQRDEVLAEAAAGELIASEVEIRSGRSESFAGAVERQRERRARLFDVVGGLGLSLAAMGTHPWANYLDQRIIDTPHYNRLRNELGWVAQRNNTWSLHLHMGVRGADRAIAVCDWLRELLPLLLAASANSPFLDRRDSGLHSVRSEIFTRTFPRCGVPSPFRDWETYAGFVGDLERFGSVVESTQLWWSVRPHHSFGTVEVRICDAQTRGDDSFALAGLIAACIAQTALDYDEGGYEGRGAPQADREIEENLWRAIRYGAGAGAARTDRRLDRAGADAAWNRPCAARAQRRPAGAGGARRGGLDRGHLPRCSGRDAPHLFEVTAGLPVLSIDSRAAKPPEE